MNKQDKELLLSIQELSQVVAELKTERDMLRKENEYLKSLIEHLASRPAPYNPPQPNTFWPNTNTPIMGCPKCGIGSDGKAYGYVCSDPSCPTKVTCT